MVSPTSPTVSTLRAFDGTCMRAPMEGCSPSPAIQRTLSGQLEGKLS